MYDQRINRSVVIALGGEKQMITAVVDLMDPMDIDYPLAVDHRPVSNDIVLFKRAGIDSFTDDRVSGGEGGGHGVGLNVQNDIAENDGHAIAGISRIVLVCRHRIAGCESAAKHKHQTHAKELFHMNTSFGKKVGFLQV